MPAADIDETLGILISSGMDPERILDYSFDEIALWARCVIRHKVGMVNAIAGPILEGMDTDYKPASVDGSKPRRKAKTSPNGFSLSQAREKMGDEAAEEALLRKFERLGPGRVRNG